MLTITTGEEKSQVDMGVFEKLLNLCIKAQLAEMFYIWIYNIPIKASHCIDLKVQSIACVPNDFKIDTLR